MRLFIVASLMVVAVQGLSIGEPVSPIFTSAAGITNTVGNFGSEAVGDASAAVVNVDNQGKAALTEGFNEGAQGIGEGLDPIESEIDQETGLPLTDIHEDVQDELGSAIGTVEDIPCPVPDATNAVQGVVGDATGAVDGVIGTANDALTQ